MIENVMEVELAAGETLRIRKNRLLFRENTGHLGRISVVSGLHGDELEGQYICYELARRMKEHPEYLEGIVDIFPALNPMGIDMANRNIPGAERDMNRTFPGDPEGEMVERMGAAIVEDILGSDVCVDLHASDIFVREIPQVRLSEEFAERLLPFAKRMNVDVIWMNATATVHESTLAHSLNMLGVPTLVIEMGQGNQINMNYGNQIVDGIFHLMKEMGLWTGPVARTQVPAMSSDGEVEFIRSKTEGIFLPRIEHNHYVRESSLLGEIVDPYTGEVKSRVIAGCEGLLFTLRAYPVVYEGDLLARILTSRRG